MNNRNKNSRSLIGEDGLDDKALGAVVGGAAKTAVPGMAAGGINEIANAAHSAAHEIEGAFGSVGAAFGGAHGPAASAGVVVAHSSPVDTVVGSQAAAGISAGASAANNAAHAIEGAFGSVGAAFGGAHGPAASAGSVVVAHSSPVDTVVGSQAAAGISAGASAANNAAHAIEGAFGSVGAALGGAHGPGSVVVAHSSPVDTVVGSHAAGGISAGASAANNAAHAIESAFASGGHGPVVAAHSSPVDTLIAGVAAGGHVTTAVADGFSEAGNAARAIESAFSSW